MRLFEMNDYVLSVREEVWALSPFKKILKRDKNRNKDIANKEIAFIYYYSDFKSDYMIISDLEERKKEIIKDLELPTDWKIDDVMQEAIAFYELRTTTILSKLCMNAMKGANAVSEYLSNTRELLEERDNNGKPVHTIATIVGGLAKIKTVLADLKVAENELIKERKETENRMKGSRTMSMFEDGLPFE